MSPRAIARRRLLAVTPLLLVAALLVIGSTAADARPRAVAPPSTTTTTTSTTTTSTTTSTTAPSTTTSTTTAPASTLPASTSTVVSSSTTVPAGPPSIVALSPTSGAPGDEVTVTGTNFMPGATTVDFGGLPVDATVRRATGRAVYDSLTFVVPPAPPGTYRIGVVNALGSSNTQPFTVTQRVVASETTTGVARPLPLIVTGPVPGSGTLARTGTDLTPLTVAGTTLLLLGLIALGLARRRSGNGPVRAG